MHCVDIKDHKTVRTGQAATSFLRNFNLKRCKPMRNSIENGAKAFMSTKRESATRKASFCEAICKIDFQTKDLKN